MKERIFIGYDPREEEAYRACVYSMNIHASRFIPAQPIILSEVQRATLYWRDTRKLEDGRLFDVVSQAPMSTEFAISRFLTPYIAQYRGWALFMDCDVMFRGDVAEIFDLADSRFAVQVVKHKPFLAEGTKMDGQAQIAYPRKCWSSVMLFNCEHPSVRALGLQDINAQTGRWLHEFAWLDDEEIGDLPLTWNWLAGVSPAIKNPSLVHYTLGIPSMRGYEHAPFADEWRAYLEASGKNGRTVKSI